MLYAIIILNNRKIDSQNVTSVFCSIKNWRRQLIGTKGRNLRKKSSSTTCNFCVCFSCAFFTLVHSYRSLPFCSGQHCKGGFTLPESSSTKVCHLRAGSCDNSVVECIHWYARHSHENMQREFTNMAAHRTARTQEECTTQFGWRCFGSGTAFTDAGNWDQHYSRGMHVAWHLSSVIRQQLMIKGHNSLPGCILCHFICSILYIYVVNILF